MWSTKHDYLFAVTVTDENAYDELTAAFMQHSSQHHKCTFSPTEYRIMGRITSGYPEAVANVVTRNIEYVTSYTCQKED